MHQGRKTLTRYTIEEEHKHPGASGEFSGLLNSLATAIKIISNQVNKGALIGALGNAGTDAASVNVQGEVQKKLDVMSNDVMLQENEWSGHLSGMASEEMENVYVLPAHCKRGKYLLVFDPLDGSSNIDVNLTVGTIFSILRAPNPGQDASLEDFLQPGTKQVCAGLALYGPSTMLVLTTGDGVDGFTLDRDIGAFILTHPHIRIPADPRVRHQHLQRPLLGTAGAALRGRVQGRQDRPAGKDFNMRWVASMVAECFRILTRGGIFMYPKDSKDPPSPVACA
jgi:fructose-1,6-bisphosphatase I